MSLLDFSLNVSSVFSKCIKFRNVLCEIIVKLRKLDLVDLVKLALEGSSLACELLCVILLGEGNVYVELLIDGLANDLILKAGNEVTRADLEGLLFCCAACKSNAVAVSCIVKNYCVAVFNSSVSDLDLAGVSLANGLDLSVNLFVCNCLNSLFDLHADVVLYSNVGLYVNLCRHYKAVVVDGNDIKFRVTNCVDAGLSKSCCVSIGKKVVDCILIEYALAVHLLNYGHRSLAFSEAGDGHVLYLLAVNCLYSLIKGCLIDRELKLVLVLLDYFGFC